MAQNGQIPAGSFTDWNSAASNIQDAIDAASNDDTVWVGAGVYLKPANAVEYEGTNVVYINKRLSLRSVSGAADTIIDGEGENRVIAWNYTPASATNLFVLDGFTIRYGFATNRGAGIYVAPGVWTGLVQNCVICSNTVAGTNTPSGGGFYVYNTAAAFSITFTNCLIQGNVVTNSLLGSDSQGGGVWLRNKGLQVFTDCVIEGNSGGQQGGGITVQHSTLTLERCIVRNNRAPTYFSSSSGGGGIAAVGNESLLVRNSLFHGNTSQGSGGAICGSVQGSNFVVEVYNSTIVSNSSSIYVRLWGVGNPSVHLYNSIIYNNGLNSGLSLPAIPPGDFTNFAVNCCFYPTNPANLTLIGDGNTDATPLFRDFGNNDFRLWPWSPTVDTGLKDDWMTDATDLVGAPRVSANDLVDMGCYETTAVPHPPAYYAAQDGQTPVAPYTNWVTAASNIQDAIDIASDGDTVWIGAGRYQGPGSGVPYNNVTNIVTLNKPLTLRGAGATRGDVLIDGEGVYRGIHVAYAASTTNLFTLSGLTVTNSNDRGILFQAATAGVIWTAVVDNCAVVNCKIGGINDDVASPNTSQRTIVITNSLVRGNLGPGIKIYFSSGGAFSSVIADTIVEQNTNSGVVLYYGTHTLSRCIVRDNTSPGSSGGLSLGVGTFTMDNCLVARNTAAGIGGAIYKWSATGPLYMYNCTIVSNLSTVSGPGGIRSAATNPIVNSVIYYNYFNGSTAPGENVYASGFTTLTNCLVPGASGSGNISVPAPVFENFAGGDYRLCAFSSGVDTGLVLAGMATATDLAGQPRVSGNGLPDMGCYETTLGTHPGHYVAQAGQTPVYPYTNWPMAASNIQDAVDAYAVGYNTTIWVGPGRYTATTNSHVRNGTNNVVDIFNKAMTLRSSDGAATTLIDGEGKYRCLYFGPGSSSPDAPYVIDGFTFTNGYAIGSGSVRCAGIYIGNEFVAAAWTARVQNCVITDNRVADPGASGGSAGGIYSGYGGVNYNQDFTFVISNCVVRNNSTNGLYYIGFCTNAHTSWTIVDSRFENNTGCGLVLNGGSHWNSIRNCRFVGNTTYGYGGGANLSVPVDVVNCLFASNQCLANGLSSNGGGALYLACQTNNVRWPWIQGCNLINCTIVDNFTTSNGVAIYQHWADNNALTLVNTIVWSNRNWNGATANHYLSTASGADVFWTNCLSSGLTGAGNIVSPVPAFENYAAGDYRLKRYSTGVDAGVSNWWISGSVDLAGQPRVSGNGLIDMGAYETSYEAHPGYYVAQSGQMPVAPYTNLTQAASNIQAAVNVYDTNYPSTIWVAPATYTLPPNPTIHAGTNIVYIDRPLTLRGSSGNPADTILDGQGAYRGIAMVYGGAGKEIVVDGLTISNCYGYTVGGGILLHDPVNGYGIPSWTGRVQNCIIVSNTVAYGPAVGFLTAGAAGGGIGGQGHGATSLIASNCVVSGNFATNGMDGVSAGGLGGNIFVATYAPAIVRINQCQLRFGRAYRGGNAFFGSGPTLTIENSVVSGGRVGYSGAQSFGGGLFLQGPSTLRNCLLYDNNSYNGRGSAINDEAQGSNSYLNIESCTIAGNIDGGYGVSIRSVSLAQGCTPPLHLVNSIIYSNSFDLFLGGGGSNGIAANYSTYASNSCVGSTNNAGLFYGPTNLLMYLGLSSGTFTNDPRFVSVAAQNLRPAFNSPCINAGVNQDWMNGAVDADGNPRISPIRNGTVDIGVYEYPIQGGSVFTLR